MAIDPLKAVIEAIGEELGALGGRLVTRCRGAHAIGDVTLNVESAYDFPLTGTLLIEGETEPRNYSGVVLTPGAQQFTGVDALEAAHTDGQEIVDHSLKSSVFETLRRATMVDYADGSDLDRIGRNEGVDRGPLLSDDDDYRELIKVVAWLARSTVHALELVLTALYPSPAVYTIYESLVEHPGVVFVTLPGRVTAEPRGHAYLPTEELVAAGGLTTVVVSETPISVASVKTQPVSQQLPLSVLPSASSPAWTFVAQSAGVEGTYFSIVAGTLQHDHPAGTDSGLYERAITELDDDFNAIECSWQGGIVLTIGGKPWKLICHDGEREYVLMWTATQIWLGQEDETVVAGPVTIAPGTAQPHQFRLERNGANVIGRYEGEALLTAPAADFSASAVKKFKCGYIDNGNANEWTVNWANLSVYTKSGHEYWNLHGADGVLTAASVRLDSAAAGWVANDDQKQIRIASTKPKNEGVWLATYVSATEFDLAGISIVDGSAVVVTPDRFFTAGANFAGPPNAGAQSPVVGKVLKISAGLNIGTYNILEWISPHEVRHDGAMVTETAISWKWDETAFETEGSLVWELIDAGSVAAKTLTLRANLPAAASPVTVKYTDVKSGQVLYDENVSNASPATAYYPAYIFGPDEWVQALLEDVTAAGPIVRLDRPF